MNDNVQRLIDLTGKTATSNKARPVEVELRKDDTGYVCMLIDMTGIPTIELRFDHDSATELAITILRLAGKVGER